MEKIPISTEIVLSMQYLTEELIADKGKTLSDSIDMNSCNKKVYKELITLNHSLKYLRDVDITDYNGEKLEKTWQTVSKIGSYSYNDLVTTYNTLIFN